MSRLRLAPLAAAIALAAAGSTCGGKGGSGSSTTSPTAPGGTTPPATNACRTYPTAANVHTTTSGSSVVFDALEAAVFDSAARTATVRTNFASGAPCSTLVSSYNSVADFVDEVSVNPPIFRTTNTINTNSGSCGAGVVTQTFTYDSQRRLTRVTSSAGGVLTYTAWDSSGRPTTGTNSGGGGTISIVYNDSARNWTETQTANGVLTTSTATFNPDGSQASIVVVQGNVTTTTTFTNTATAQVCR